MKQQFIKPNMICSHSRTTVVDSRDARGGTRRRRECTICGYRYTTLEIKISSDMSTGDVLQKLKEDFSKEAVNNKLQEAIDIICSLKML